MPVVTLDHVSRIFPASRTAATVRAVSDLTLEVAVGESLALLGPSGSGKTTTLRLIAGLDQPTSGDVRFDGRSQQGIPPGDRGVAMVFQDHPLLPHLDVARNLQLISELGGMAKPERARLFQEAVRWLELEPLLARRTSQLSGGERQRVALGQAFMRQPKLLLLDEPFAHVDAPHRVRLRADLQRLRRARGWTMVCVTHDQREAAVMADRVAVLDRGVLRQCDTFERLRGHPADTFVAGFVGSPPMNLFTGVLEPGTHEVRFTAHSGWSWSLPVDVGPSPVSSPRRVQVGVRAQHLRFVAGEGDLSSQAVLEVVDLSEEGRATLIIRLGVDTALVQVPSASPEAAMPLGTVGMLRPDAGALHWFDAESGRRLDAGLAG